MIIVFGGTTEGRKAVEVLEQSGRTFYYSTMSDAQQLELTHGVHLTGAMDVPMMAECCRSRDIRLIIDAAHPFATELHRNLLFLARHIGAPIVRYDRIYPTRSDDLVWCHDYHDAMAKLEEHGVDRLLALTGVNNIGTLRPYWQKHECWFRILNRLTSQMLATKWQFPADHLVYYEEGEQQQAKSPAADKQTAQLIDTLKPQAILTKESGVSGGFVEKVQAATERGVKVFVIERPEYPPHTPIDQHVSIEHVNGPHGLRRAVERLLPEFYPLHSGITTGTCATAAAIAATMEQLPGFERKSDVAVLLPDGETINVPISYGDGYASCTKDAGDDPDVTDGIEIRATVCIDDGNGEIDIRGGEGIGTITLPGFDYEPGSPAINKGPRSMIEQNIRAVIGAEALAAKRITVIITAPQGAEIARRTFNPRLGIEGGISIIGVSGIVKPFSEDAFIESIRKCIAVAKASGTERIVLGSGGKSERFLKGLYPDLPALAFVEYGNYIGHALSMASKEGFAEITLGVMLGKAVKLAEGMLDTHSRHSTMNREFIFLMLSEAGCSPALLDDLESTPFTLVRELWQRLPAEKLDDFARVVISHCSSHCRPLIEGSHLTLLLISDEGDVFGVKS